MRNKYAKEVLLCALSFCVLVGCEKNGVGNARKDMDLESLGKIAVCVREEGSGTRDMFSELVVDSDDIGGSPYEAQGSEQVISYVAENANAIGYTSKGTADNEPEILLVESDKSIVRPFQLAYIGELGDVEADFVKYVLSKGQAIVSKKYSETRKVTSFLSDQSEGTIKIGGSSSMAELLTELAGEYMQINPNATIEIETTDTKDGINGAIDGRYDLGMVSRSLSDYEKQILEVTEIAEDEIVIIINRQNPIQYLSFEEIADIYKGTYTSWNELKGE